MFVHLNRVYVCVRVCVLTDLIIHHFKTDKVIYALVANIV